MRPHGKYAAVDATNPEAFAQCDRCGFWYNRSDLVWQDQWSGTHLYNIGQLVCRRNCYDKPFEQLRTIILPPDPPPVLNARPPNFAYENAGPVQSILSQNVVQGNTLLPVVDATGFEEHDLAWVQLNNGDLGQVRIIGVDLINNILSIADPLPFSAPIYGVVSVDGSFGPALQLASAEFDGHGSFRPFANVAFATFVDLLGSGNLNISLSATLLAFASLPGLGNLTALSVSTSTITFSGVGSLTATLPILFASGFARFSGAGNLSVDTVAPGGTPELDFSNPGNSQYIGMFP